MSEEHFVIIGNGPAGNQAALTVREKAPDARISMVSKSQKPSYWRRLLPGLIAGEIEEDALYLSSFNSYKEVGIKLRSGQEVVDLDLDKRELIFDHKEVLPFSGLIIAVGGKPRIPEPLHPFKDHMLTLKTVEDAKEWIKKISKVDSIFIVGGDLTSFAVTKALLKLNKKIYFMVNEAALWPIRPNAAVLDSVVGRLEEKGVEVIKWRTLKSISRLSDYLYLIQTDDQSIEAGLIGAFFGLVPDVEFLARSGFTIDRGILVDEYLNTGQEGIYATGDCAQIYHPEIRDYWISVGDKNAIALGRIAGLNLLGDHVRAEMSRESIFDSEGIRVNTSWWMEY